MNFTSILHARRKWATVFQNLGPCPRMKLLKRARMCLLTVTEPVCAQRLLTSPGHSPILQKNKELIPCLVLAGERWVQGATKPLCIIVRSYLHTSLCSPHRLYTSPTFFGTAASTRTVRRH